ncbi:MAG: hypothetical protein RLZZ316_2444 [Bacteroidota bacterium]|jgi:hypothetical protein
MKIKLTKAGGIAGKKMSATADANLNAQEWDELIDLIKRENNGRVKKEMLLTMPYKK